MIEIEETINLATRSIWRNKARSGLTALGIIIGVAAVILLVSVGQGLSNYITSQFEELGTNLIYVFPGTVQFGQGPPNFSGSKMTLRHVDEIRQLGDPIKETAADSDIPGVVKYKGESKVTTVGNVSASWVNMINIDVSDGRMLTESDEDLRRNVAVLGQTVAEDFFGNTNPVGKEITIQDEKFQVIGLIEEIGTQSIGLDIDNFVAIPITVGQRIFDQGDAVQTIIIQAQTKDDIDEVIDMVERYMLTQMDEDDFEIIDSSGLLETINNILGVLTAALGGIAAISLVVGGVGIMNIMLVSVTERTREIGLRKAVGAKPSDIRNQFLIEAVVLSVVGGGIGIAIGWAGSLALNQFFPTSVTFWAVALSFGVSAAVGIIFGVAPAIRASRLDPIEALRYE